MDIFLFGSFLKGKFRPRDIDVCVVFKKCDYRLPKKIYHEFKKIFGERVHYNWILCDEIFNASLFPTLIEEGYSLIHDYSLNKKLGYDSFIIFSYNLKGFSASKKVLFSYALHGKGRRKGIIEEVKGEILGRNAVLIPKRHSEEFREFLETWKVDYYAKNVLVSV